MSAEQLLTGLLVAQNGHNESCTACSERLREGRTVSVYASQAAGNRDFETVRVYCWQCEPCFKLTRVHRNLTSLHSSCTSYVQRDEIVIALCAKLAHEMSASNDPRRVHFQSPEYLVERLDAIAELFDKDRTDLLVEAIREYIEDTADNDTFQELVATKYYDGQLEFEMVKQLVGAETAQRLRLLKADLEGEPLDLAAPEDVDIYDGDATAVATDDADDR